MLGTLSTLIGFVARLAALLPGLGLARAGVAPPTFADRSSATIRKLGSDRTPAGKGFITPLIIHNGLIYITGQGAHSG